MRIAMDIVYSSNKLLGSQVVIDVIINSKKVKSVRVRLPFEIKKSDVKKVADEVKKFIEGNLRKGIKYTGGKVAPLKPATIEAKKRKGRPQPARVFVDSGQLIKGLKIVTLGAGYSVTFRDYTYPDSGDSMMKVATELNEGRDNMVARPFFGMTQKKFDEIINKTIGKRRIPVNVKRAAEITRQLIEIRRRTGNILAVRQVNRRRPQLIAEEQ